jgi:hypothetical protein
MSVETNSEIAHEILSFALEGKVWPTGRKYVAAEWVDKSEQADNLMREPLAADWAPDVPLENIVSSETIQDVLYNAAQRNPETGLPLYPHFALPIENVRIQGRLQRLGESMPFPIRFKNCIFEDGIHFKDSRLLLLSIKHCAIPFISLKRVVVEQSIVIEHCAITHGLNLRGAQIGGLLGLKHSRLSGDGEKHPGLDLRNAHIGSGVFLRYGFRCDGLVDLSGATIKGSLDCGNGQFHCKNNKKTNRPISLRAKNASIDGSVFLNNEFSAIGEVDFRRATIGAQMTVREASLIQNNIQKDWNPEVRRFFALNLENATIAQDITLVNLHVLEGDIGLQGATAKVFSARPQEWLDNRRKLNGKIWLSGFKYDSVSRTSKRSYGQTRVKWLKTILPDHYLGRNFIRQPWEHLASVLKMGGEYTAADALYVEAENQGFRQSFRGERGTTFGKFTFVFSILFIIPYYFFMRTMRFGYGLGHLRIIVLLTAFWLVNAVGFEFTASTGRMKPAEEEITIFMERHGNGKVPAYYVHFNSLIYSLDLIVPFELGQSSRWTPMTPDDKPFNAPESFFSRQLNKVSWLQSWIKKLPRCALWVPKYWSWLSIIVGWISFILMGAAFAGQFRRDRN